MQDMSKWKSSIFNFSKVEYFGGKQAQFPQKMKKHLKSTFWYHYFSYLKKHKKEKKKVTQHFPDAIPFLPWMPGHGWGTAYLVHLWKV